MPTNLHPLLLLNLHPPSQSLLFLNLPPPSQFLRFLNLPPPNQCLLFLNLHPPSRSLLFLNLHPPSRSLLFLNLHPPSRSLLFLNLHSPRQSLPTYSLHPSMVSQSKGLHPLRQSPMSNTAHLLKYLLLFAYLLHIQCHLLVCQHKLIIIIHLTFPSCKYPESKPHMEECGKVYAYRSSLAKHKKKEHPETLKTGSITCNLCPSG